MLGIWVLQHPAVDCHRVLCPCPTPAFRGNPCLQLFYLSSVPRGEGAARAFSPLQTAGLQLSLLNAISGQLSKLSGVLSSLVFFVFLTFFSV